ncbi:MAG: M15 family metallopeptidase [Prochlorococcaceae cyanobacterium]
MLLALAAATLLALGAAAAAAESGGDAPLRCGGTALVSLLRLSPRPLLELRYGSPYNFMEETLYARARAQLRCPVALALQQVQQDLAAEGLGLKVWDAYRPLAVQQRMWDKIQDERYVSNPAVNAGRHTRGTAVDVTLVDRLGRELPMPTPFDDFTPAAHRDAPGISPEAAANALRLQRAMERRGFVGCRASGGISTGTPGAACRRSSLEGAALARMDARHGRCR